MGTTRGKTKVKDESLRKEVKEPNGSTWQKQQPADPWAQQEEKKSHYVLRNKKEGQKPNELVGQKLMPSQCGNP